MARFYDTKINRIMKMTTTKYFDTGMTKTINLPFFLQKFEKFTNIVKWFLFNFINGY